MENDQRMFGLSFSLHRASELGLDKRKLLKAALEELGCRRFRLMSYWNIHEPVPGAYDFSELDWQLDMIAAYGGTVTLCLGKRQPRWPECHMPQWATLLSRPEWYQALYEFIETVVRRYMHHPALESWQLENEALLKSFGHCPDGDYSHRRLRHERQLVRRIDPTHPLIMTLSDSWGLPWRKPRPDAYAMSMYRITLNKRGAYAYSKRPAMFYRLRAGLITAAWRRPVFIHELQAEPWLPTALSEVPVNEQLKYMNKDLLLQNVGFAVQTGMHPIDIWGLEWWWWLTMRGEQSLWQAAQRILSVPHEKDA